VKRANVYICVHQRNISETLYKVIKQRAVHYNVYIGFFTTLENEENTKVYENLCSKKCVRLEHEEEDRKKYLKELKPIELIYDNQDTYMNSPEKLEEYQTLLVSWNGQCKLLSSLIGNSTLNKLKQEAGLGNQTPISLSKLLKEQKFVRIIESHSGLTCMLLQNLKVEGENGRIKEFDGFWISSLCDSLLRGKPDMEVIDVSDRINSIQWMLTTTNKPIIVDLDSGGRIEQFVHSVQKLSRIGVSAVVIEDKIGQKVNSLCQENSQKQDTITEFCKKITKGKDCVKSRDTMIVARIESLTLGKTVKDALKRARAYVDAGADAILVHNNTCDTSLIEDFCEGYNKFENRVPLIVIPSTYSYVYEKDLQKMGCNMVIYANQITRSIIPIMLNTAENILVNERALEASLNCISIKDVLEIANNGL